MALHHIKLTQESTDRLKRLSKALESSLPAVVSRALKALEREESALNKGEKE